MIIEKCLFNRQCPIKYLPSPSGPSFLGLWVICSFHHQVYSKKSSTPYSPLSFSTYIGAYSSPSYDSVLGHIPENQSQCGCVTLFWSHSELPYLLVSLSYIKYTPVPGISTLIYKYFWHSIVLRFILVLTHRVGFYFFLI